MNTVLRYYSATVLLLTATALAQANGRGTTGADFLKLGYGPRAVGMGEAFTAVTGDPANMFWNPAGMAALNYPNASFSTTLHFAGIKYGMANFIQPWKTTQRIPTQKPKNSKRSLSTGVTVVPEQSISSGWVWGVGLIYLNAGKIPETALSPSNTVILLDDNAGASDTAFQLGLAHGKSRMSWGANLKIIQRKLGSESASTVACDAGWDSILWKGRTPDMITVGASILHLGKPLDFRDDTSYTDALPLTLRTGVALQKKSFLATMDLVKALDSTARLNLGMEYVVTGIAIRGGYKALGYEARDPLGGLFGFSMGVGIPFYVFEGSMDYAFVPYGDLGASHHISVNIPFGRIERGVHSQNWYDR